MLKVAWEPHAGAVRGYWGPLVICSPLLTGASEHSITYSQIPCYGNQSLSLRDMALQWHGSSVLPMSLQLRKPQAHEHVCLTFSSSPFFSPLPLTQTTLRQPASLCISNLSVDLGRVGRIKWRIMETCLRAHQSGSLKEFAQENTRLVSVSISGHCI